MARRPRSAAPTPGRRARGTRTGRPIMVLLDLLGRRWTLRVLWELRGTALTFRALRSACDDISPSVLNTRLRELRENGLVAHDAETGFALSAQGRTLLETFLPLQVWADRWAAGHAHARSAPSSTARSG